MYNDNLTARKGFDEFTAKGIKTSNKSLFPEYQDQEACQKSVEPIDYQSSKEALRENKAIRETKWILCITLFTVEE